MTSVWIDIERPAAVVFSYATDPTRFHEWQQGVASGSMERKGAPAVGDHCRTTRRIGGSERPSTSELVRLPALRIASTRHRPRTSSCSCSCSLASLDRGRCDVPRQVNPAEETPTR